MNKKGSGNQRFHGYFVKSKDFPKTNANQRFPGLFSKGKKGNLWIHWPETIALIVLIIGFIFASFSGSAFMSYVIIFLFGAFFGRLWFHAKLDFKFKWFMIIAAFLLGFVLRGAYGDARIIIVLFVIGVILSYYLHNKKIIKSAEY